MIESSKDAMMSRFIIHNFFSNRDTFETWLEENEYLLCDFRKRYVKCIELSTYESKRLSNRVVNKKQLRSNNFTLN